MEKISTETNDSNTQNIMFNNDKLLTDAQSAKPITKKPASGRPVFKKSHTCGSLFAKCACSSSGGSTPLTEHEQRRKKFFHTYSHPDTAFVFTDENKNAPFSTENRTKSRKSEATRSKRLSSPNIGDFMILDVAVHPEVVLTVSQTDGVVEPRYGLDSTSTTNRSRPKPIFKKSLSAFRSDSLNSLEALRGPNITRHDSFPKNNTHEEPNMASSYDSSASARDSYFRLILENKFSKLTAEDFEKTKLKNLEYLKYNALGYQQDSNSDLTTDVDEDVGLEMKSDSSEKSTLKKKSSSTISHTALEKQGSISECSSEDEISQHTVVVRKSSKQNINSNHHHHNHQQHESHHHHNQHELQLENEVLRLKEQLQERDNEITKLKREIHKLKSVLQQTTATLKHNMNQNASTNSIEDDELLSSLQSHHRMAGQMLPMPINIISNNFNNNNNNNSIITTPPSEATSPTTTLQTNLGLFLQANQTKSAQSTRNNSTNQMLSAAHLPIAVKKQGVSGESSDATGQFSRDILIKKYDKDFRSKQLIKDAIMDNDFLKNIDSSQVRELVDSMYSQVYNIGDYVIREGEAGAHLFVSAEGDFEVFKDDKVLGIMGPGKAFGELAILYNCTRTASIKVLSDARVWVLDRRVFQQIMMRSGMQRIEENVNFLRSVPLLKNLSNNLLAKIADVLEVEFYPAGAYVIRQGATGDTFFLISQGTVKVTQKLTDDNVVEEEDEIRLLGRGDYFGEQALIKEDKRTANIIAMSPGVECLTLDRESFKQLIGDLCELREKNYGDETRMLAMKRSESRGFVFGSEAKQELLDIELDDLDPITTLGIGGFGRVELVKVERDNEIKTYALKCLKKQHILETRQQEHVFSERTIMLSCNTPFICRLYRTYRDSKYLYMLLEACMGGEIWTILRDRGYFDDQTTQFIIGCVLQAFEYLHKRGIVYRDLKPENLMLDSRGYVKLVDFGFSKYIGYSSKTWTFCGTPEYVAPEIILNKGHDRAADYWALGILIHELLTGTPPFTGNDPMKTYNIILKGIDMVDFPKHMTRAAITVIKRLCRDIPAERLGYQRGGIKDIKKHKWFQGFDWEGLKSLSLTPPILHAVSGPLDTSHFDDFPMDEDIPDDELSGWDKDF